MSCNRRELIEGLLGLGGAILVAVPGRRALAQAAAGASAKPLFAADHWRTLQAMMECLLPGAIEAGVPGYFEYWLEREPYQRSVRYLRAGAAHLDRVARALHGKRFVDSAGEEQDAVLAEFQAGQVNVKKFKGKVFFQQMFQIVLEGWLSRPEYGGNRGGVGWKYVGRPDGLRSCWWNPKGVQRVLDPGKKFCD